MTDTSPSPPQSEPQLATSQGPRRASMGVLFLTVFVDLVGFSIIFPLFPDMLDHYIQSDGPESLIGSLAGWLSEFTRHPDPERQRLYTTALFGGILGSIYSALQFVFAPFWGRLSDRTGRRPILLVSITGLALAYLVWVFAGSFELLILSRVVGGSWAATSPSQPRRWLTSPARRIEPRGWE